jgi:hypothetical protein
MDAGSDFYVTASKRAISVLKHYLFPFQGNDFITPGTILVGLTDYEEMSP